MKVLAKLKGWSTNTYFSAATDSYRSYATYAPRKLNAEKPNPLVVALHGMAGSFYEFVFTNLAKCANEHQFIVVCPAGLAVVAATGVNAKMCPAVWIAGIC